MMERDKFANEIEVTCDNCEELSLHGPDWQEAIATIKSEGWLIRKIGDVWKHLCKDCKEKGVDISKV
jgi:hypothetical protein